MSLEVGLKMGFPGQALCSAYDISIISRCTVAYLPETLGKCRKAELKMGFHFLLSARFDKVKGFFGIKREMSHEYAEFTSFFQTGGAAADR